MNKNILKLLIITITLIFIISYVIADSGYYEYTVKQQTTITNEKIKEFENDIKNNINIDLKNYLNGEKKDYTNKFSNILYNISKNSNKITRELIQKIFKKLSLLVEE